MIVWGKYLPCLSLYTIFRITFTEDTGYQHRQHPLFVLLLALETQVMKLSACRSVWGTNPETWFSRVHRNTVGHRDQIHLPNSVEVVTCWWHLNLP